MHLLETKCWLFKFCFRAVSDIYLWAFHNNTNALILTKHFYCCSVSAWCGYRLFGRLKAIIRLLDIKFWPLKICFRSVLVVISFAYRQERCTGFGETFFPCSMHAWRVISYLEFSWVFIYKSWRRNTCFCVFFLFLSQLHHSTIITCIKTFAVLKTVLFT